MVLLTPRSTVCLSAVPVRRSGAAFSRVMGKVKVHRSVGGDVGGRLVRINPLGQAVSVGLGPGRGCSLRQERVAVGALPPPDAKLPGDSFLLVALAGTCGSSAFVLLSSKGNGHVLGGLAHCRHRMNHMKETVAQNL